MDSLAAMDRQSLWVTCRLALTVTPLLILAALPLAGVLAFSRFPGQGLVEATCNLPLVLPTTVLGFFLLVAMSPTSPLGRAWEDAVGARLVFSYSGLVLASMVFNLPFALQPLRAAFRKIDPRLIEAAYVLGCSRAEAFVRVVLPNSLPGLAAAAVLVFAHTMGEFGVALMVGGSIPGSTRVASIAIFERVEMLDYGAAMLLSLALVPPAYVVLLALRRMEDAR